MHLMGEHAPILGVQMLIISLSLQSFPSKLPPKLYPGDLRAFEESYEESENAEAEAQAPTDQELPKQTSIITLF